MAKRANATTTEADASHVVMVSRPAIVADVIATVATTLEREAASATH